MDSIKASSTYGRIASGVLCILVVLKNQLDLDIGDAEIQTTVDAIVLSISGFLAIISKIREQLR